MAAVDMDDRVDMPDQADNADAAVEAGHVDNADDAGVEGAAVGADSMNSAVQNLAGLDLAVFFDHPEQIGHEVGFTDMLNLYGYTGSQADWHDRIILSSLDGFNLSATFNAWPHVKEAKGLGSTIELVVVIDNIEFVVCHTIYFTNVYFYFHDSEVDTDSIYEMHICPDSGAYVDTGL